MKFGKIILRLFSEKKEDWHELEQWCSFTLMQWSSIDLTFIVNYKSTDRIYLISGFKYFPTATTDHSIPN